MNPSSGPIQRDLARLAIRLIVITLIAGGIVGIALSGTARRDVWASLGVVLGAMLIGFVPLRLFLRQGPDNIVAGQIAAMILRMLACLIGLVLLLKRYHMSPLICVATVCSGYLFLLAAETIGMNRLMRNAFDQQTQDDRETK